LAAFNRYRGVGVPPAGQRGRIKAS